MFVRKQSISCPNSFPFPFKPYSIQNKFMRALYSVIENRKIGIFESPTGTGKTLSALKWLSDHHELNRVDLMETIQNMEKEIKAGEAENAKSDDWLAGQYGLLEKKEQLNKLQEQLKAMDEYDHKIIEMRKKWKDQLKIKSLKKFKESRSNDLLENDYNKTEPVDNDDEFVIEDNDGDGYEQDEIEDLLENQFQNTKIYFCSRTHSQLSQVVNELKKTVYGNKIRLIQLASRQQLCINTEVRSLKSNALINERCLELKKRKSNQTCCQSTQTDQEGHVTKKSKVMKPSTSCPFYSQDAIANVSHNALYNSDSIMDIEDLLRTAKTEKGCPYYAARAAQVDAEVVMLPYQMLLHKKTREQLDINIKDSVVIIDEAHNLLDTIASIHSAEITADQLHRIYQQLNAYKTKYLDRFSTRNLLRLNQLIFIANRFMTIMRPTKQSQIDEKVEFTSQMMLTHELLDDINISYSNLLEIVKFCEETRLAQKINGFALQYATVEVSVQPKSDKKNPAHLCYLQELSHKQSSKNQNQTQNRNEESTLETEKPLDNTNHLGSASLIRIFLSFLEALLEKSTSTDGRILISKHRTIQSKTFMKYLLLNASEPFAELLNECRSVIVAGGTMQPTTEFKTQLFQNVIDRIEEHFYGHVVASEAILPIVVPKGPRNSSFLFNYMNRGNMEMLADLTMVIQNICSVVPAGIVCFFTSYDVMDNFYYHLIESKSLERIEKKKKVFKEPRSGGHQTEKMLSDYTKAVKSASKCVEAGQQTGALLMSVVGGKLSEGLNFSDDLGRCVCIVGLPFPNKTNPELAEKMKYLDKISLENNKTDKSVKTFSSSEYYENLCMKAVNQCIGRAIRHINDYASVLLIDERYQQERIKIKLPKWIQTSLQVPAHFGGVQGSLVKFFKQKK
ncbi:ATP-dependent DNA helicase DDX11 isoform X2 [Contarinia nasturtii]|uniref:ATP-dependent DNA helicase DDX11 isoform X2 n=1 Tax=Contarinia nasturtii TaxID=265458 RepID=UPI0012D4443F|nr:ATP-dependent DNA helicase DDX11 isoform X2 [Contarinia nasturtii]